MRAIIGAMTEENHDKRSWRANALIGTFLFLNLAINLSVRQQTYFAKNAILTYNSEATKGGNEALDADSAVFIFTTTVVAVQVLMAAIVLTIVSPHSRGDVPIDREALTIVAISHAGSCFFRDFLLQMGASDDVTSVQDVAFFSPCLALAGLWLVTSVPSRPISWAALFIIGVGCSMLTTQHNAGSGPVTNAVAAASNRAILISGLAYFVVAMRNIILRQMVQIEGMEFKSRHLPAPHSKAHAWTAVSGIASVVVIGAFFLAPPGFGMAVLCAAVTCGLSVALFFVTTHVLRGYGVTSAALFGVWALLLEALMSSPISPSPTFLTSLAALVLLTAGHWLYLRHLSETEAGVANSGADSLPSTYHRKPASTHEQYTRLEFLLFASAVVGVVFYVFQPQVSQRDLDTLSYVGLDKVIRRLLSVPAGAEIPAQVAAEDPAHAQAAHSLS